MSLHKLTAGDGYTYLTRQVAAHDATHRGRGGLGDYYTHKGEAPGQWMGSGLAGLDGFDPAAGVSEAQMLALFGQGRHPDAERIQARLLAAGSDAAAAHAATLLGRVFAIGDGASEYRTRVADAMGDYNSGVGFPRDWPVPVAERARIRTTVVEAMFAQEYGRAPLDSRERAGYLARVSRQATTAVAGYDLTFSPVKSVSALWAIAPLDVAGQIEAAHVAAVADTIAWLEDRAVYTRTGVNAAAQVDVAGLIAAAFTHRDSRAGDPDLHTHVAVSNKVQTLDGRWLALDGRPLHKAAVAASERYNTRLEAQLVERLGVRFAPRTQSGRDEGKRPVREIVGVDEALLVGWSSRRAAIDVRRGQLATRFQADHGRPPSVVEAIHLAQQATLETRDRKHKPRSHAEQRATWQGEAVALLGDPDGVVAMLDRALSPGRHRRQTVVHPTRAWVHATAVEVVATVQATRATWQECHVRAEAERRARTDRIALADLDAAVDAVVARALSPQVSVPLGGDDPVTRQVGEPAVLRRRDGTSVYSTAGTQLFTSTPVLAAEQSLLATAGLGQGWACDPGVVDLAVLESAANTVPLNPGQAHLVRELATSGRRLQLALAPAGTGKTTALRVLARAWTDSGGHVLGLAPSAAAAAVLREELGTHTDTLAKLTHTLDTATTSRQVPPQWVTAIGPSTLVVIDEAGMASTTDLARVVEHVTARGASVRLVGDDQQLAAIGAGGVLRDIADTHGATTLTQVVRFTDLAEGAASLALRAGDPASIGYYTDHARLHVGDLATVTDHAYTAWHADITAGRDAVMLAPTRDLVAALNARAQADRHPTTGAESGVTVGLSDGSRAGVGDTVISRANARRLVISASDWVKNGDRWTVTAVHPDGALAVTHTSTHRRLVLPAAYVAEHVALGYATTVHGAQGVTADVAHTVATGEETRQVVYVAMTRGRTANHLYLTVAGDGDDHTIITRDALLPPTAVDVLTRVLARDGAQTSATTTARRLSDPAVQLHGAVDRYADALITAATATLGRARLESLTSTAESLLPGLTDSHAWDTLRGHLALLAADGHDPTEELRTALGRHHGLADADDPAAVLDWRLDPTGRRTSNPGPLAWLPAIPARLADDPTWGPYLSARASLVHGLANRLAGTSTAWTATSGPAWAGPLVERAPALVSDLAVWRAATGVPDTDHRLTGPPAATAAAARHQRRLKTATAAVLGDAAAAAHRWADLVASIDARIIGDPYWPTLAARLDDAARAGLHIPSLLEAATANPDSAGGTAGPLPDEQPAAALWWRLARHLPATVTMTGPAPAPRPMWAPLLTDMFGVSAAQRIHADPAWPTLVAAVSAAGAVGWSPAVVLSTAYELLDGAFQVATETDESPTGPIPPDQLTGALLRRIAQLTSTDTPTASHSPGPAPNDLDDLPDPYVRRGHWLPPDNPAADLDQYPDQYSSAGSDPEDVDNTAVGWTSGGVQDSQDQLERPLSAVEFEDDSQIHAQVQAELAVIAARPYDPTPPPAALEEASDTVVARILELNAAAASFYAGHYPRSWAAEHLRDRFGHDLADHPQFTPGYAPPGWRSLTDHLRGLGATDHDIVTAGLGVYAAGTSRVLDRFRDRLVLPIRSDHGIVAFTARRHPDRGQDAGPKYVNTADTPAYRKSEHLYALADHRTQLAAGAAPVLVEGPLDAIAVTLAGAGHYIGVAPLGTALTAAQARQLRAHHGPNRDRVIVATDNDPAGRAAATRAFNLLTAHGGAPRHLPLPDCSDPADLYRSAGPAALAAALTAADDLGSVLIAHVLAAAAPRLDNVTGRVEALRGAASIAVALPPDRWPAHIDMLTTHLDLLPATVHREVLAAAHQWTLTQHDPVAPRPEPAPPLGGDRTGVVQPSKDTLALPAPTQTPRPVPSRHRRP